jgi:cytoskeletal protein CcmA (bactofilin family)
MYDAAAASSSQHHSPQVTARQTKESLCMWKSTPGTGSDSKPATPSTAPALNTAPPPRPSIEPVRSKEFASEMAHIGKSVVIRGELSGSEDLYLDGEVEGNITLLDHNLIIGPNGRVRANVTAKDVVVHGKVDGNIQGYERVELKKSAVLSGDISTQRIVIEDGAFFKGAIDIRKESKSEPKREMAAAAAAGYSGSSSPSGSGMSAQRSLVESKFEPKG